MEVTNGCNQSSTLGNAFVISVMLWIALSGFYRAVAFVAVPEVTFVESLCIVGYSYFAWCAALSLSYLMGLLYIMKGLWLSIPLVVLGLPASFVQSMLFYHKLPRVSLSSIFSSNSHACGIRHSLKLLAIGRHADTLSVNFCARHRCLQEKSSYVTSTQSSASAPAFSKDSATYHQQHRLQS